MKNYTRNIIFFIALITALPLFADSEFVRLHNSRYGLSFLVPSEWRLSRADLDYKSVYIIRRNKNTDITLKLSDYSDVEMKKWESWKEWYLDGIGRKLTEIIEEKDIPIDKGITGRIIVFEYYSGRIKFLQRIMLARFNNTLLVIECRAPFSSYHKYAETFTAVMSSLIPDKK